MFFLGAGFSKAFGLPNTAELLGEVHTLARSKGLRLDRDLNDAYKYFYPEEGAAQFRPEVVDFFSVIRAYEDVGRSLPGGFRHPTLLDDLKLTIARLLFERTRQLTFESASLALRDMLAPGNIVITSNWDPVVEWYCSRNRVPLRLTARRPDDQSLILLKLHGSVDWTLVEDKKGDRRQDFASLLERLNPPRPYLRRWQVKEQVLRMRALESMSKSWQFVRARTRRPYLATMARRKSSDLQPLAHIWDDAYAALGRARELTIIGYSMPPDDVEIRTLLRAGIVRGPRDARVLIRNPAPDVHVRIRTWIEKRATSDYSPFAV